MNEPSLVVDGKVSRPGVARTHTRPILFRNRFFPGSVGVSSGFATPLLQVTRRANLLAV